MSLTEGWISRRERALDRIALLRAGFAPVPARIAAEPDPQWIGSPALGRRLLAGHLRLAGVLLPVPPGGIWEIAPPSPAFARALHGFDWLDDLAAEASPAARAQAADWAFLWIARFGRRRGWAAPVAGRRALRLIAHADVLLGEAGDEAALRRSLARHRRFLSLRAESAPAGIARIEALAGWLATELADAAPGSGAGGAAARIAREADRTIGADGAIASRNPEELLDLMARLAAAARGLAHAGIPVPVALSAAIARAAPVLRGLRHADGGLVRFHGGGRGRTGLAEAALAGAPRPAAARAQDGGAGTRAMGCIRLSAGRTTLIADAAPPPAGSATAHASAAAFELTSARRPLVVSCGSGLPFGGDRVEAGRATPSHSCLGIEGFSSSRLGRGGRLADTPSFVETETRHSPGALSLTMTHDGYVRTHGLTHIREVELSSDGRGLRGIDALAALTAADHARLQAARAENRGQPAGFAIRFHLHPDVEARREEDDVVLRLPGGEIWRFRHDRAAVLTIEPSVYLDPQRVAPRATRQIVLSGQIRAQGMQAGWTLAKSEDTPLAIRDLEPAADEAV